MTQFLVTKVSKKSITDVTESLLLTAKANDFRGYDPFDGLNSGLFAASGLSRWRLACIAWLQFHKRSPINFRVATGVQMERNPKGIALFILGLLHTHERTSESNMLETAEELGRWLLTCAVDRRIWHHYAWGYHFDWAARAFYVPKGKPNAITTCYVARALFALGSVTGKECFTNAALDAGNFLASLYQNSNGEKYFAYIPGETAFVHNASLWSAALVAKSGKILGDQKMSNAALEAANQSVSMQRSDGAWAYGTRAHHDFIDGFHTGYNLEALLDIQTTFDNTGFQCAIDKGMAFYKANFFLPDGTVKYFHNQLWPLDTHSYAEAILTLMKVGGSKDDLLLASRVTDRLISDLYLSSQRRFVYQKNRYFTNKINYLRWTQAWAFYALAFYLEHAPKVDHDHQRGNLG